MSKNFEVSVSNRLSTGSKRQTDGHDKIFVKGRTPQERRQWLRKKGLCRNCSHHEKGQSCWAAEADCFRCGKIGHIAHLCPENHGSEDSSLTIPTRRKVDMKMMTIPAKLSCLVEFSTYVLYEIFCCCKTPKLLQ